MRARVGSHEETVAYHRDRQQTTRIIGLFRANIEQYLRDIRTPDYPSRNQITINSDIESLQLVKKLRLTENWKNLSHDVFLSEQLFFECDLKYTNGLCPLEKYWYLSTIEK